MNRPITLCAALLALAGGVTAQAPAGTGLNTQPAVTLTLTLTDALDLAVRNNIELQTALIDEQIQRERIKEALGAFDPALFAEVSGGRSEFLAAQNFPLEPANPMSPTVTRIITQVDNVGRADVGVRGVLDTGMSYDLTFSTNYRRIEQDSGLNPIFTNFMRMSFTQPLLRTAWSSYQEAPVEIARIQTLAFRETYRITLRTKVGEIEQAYYDLVFAIEEREVKRQSLALADQQLDITRLRVETGGLAEIEITSAEAAQATRRAELVTAESNVVEAEDRLRRQILSFDRPSDWEIRIVPTEEADEKFVELRPLNEILQLAERSHPELLRAHLEVARAKVDLRQRESERSPTLDLTGSLTATGLADDADTAWSRAYIGNQGATSWNLGLAFEYPLGNRTADARVAQSLLGLRRASLELQDTRTEMIYRVRNAIRNTDLARRSIAARKEACRLAQEQLDNERLRLELKKSTNYLVFEVADTFNQRKTELIRALLDYRLALLELSRASGTPLQRLIQSP